MVTTSTTKAAFVKAVLLEMGNVRRLNKMSGSARMSYVLARIQRVREYEVVTAHQAMVAYAVEWSLQSLRLNMEPEQALLAMDTRQIVGLVYDLSKACKTQIDVTYRLNAMYARKEITMDNNVAVMSNQELAKAWDALSENDDRITPDLNDEWARSIHSEIGKRSIENIEPYLKDFVEA